VPGSQIVKLERIWNEQSENRTRATWERGRWRRWRRRGKWEPPRVIRISVTERLFTTISEPGKGYVRTSNRFDWDCFFRAACVTYIFLKSRFSCITWLKIHRQLKNHCTELSSTDLQWKIFCGITSYDYNSKKRLGYVTSPESKMAERDVSISHFTDFVFLSISTLFGIGLVFHWA